jgi:adenylate cyclase
MSRRVLTAVAIGAVICASVLGLRAVGALETADLAVYESYLRARAEAEGAESPVVILKLTDEDRRELGRWPVSDAMLAAVVDRLIAAEARVIGIDLSRDLPVPPGSAELEARLRSDERIFGVRSFPTGLPSDIPPPRGLAGTERIGFAEMLPDPDGKVRRALLFQGDGTGYVEYAFALRLALGYLRLESVALSNDPSVPEFVRLGPTTIPRLDDDAGGYVDADAGGYQFLVDFERAEEGFGFFRLTDLLRGEVDPARIRDRIVIIGATAAGAYDVFDAPVASSLEAGRGMPGVELHGHITDQLVRFGLGESHAIHVLADGLEALSIAVAVVLGLGVGLALRSVGLFALAMLAGLALLWLGGLWVFHLGWWFPIAGPALAWVSGASLVTAWVSSQEKLQRSLLMQLFSRHVSHEVADEVWAHREDFLAGGRPRPQRLMATVLFLDIKDSTPPTEKLDPEQLMDWVNRFMQVMARQIAEHGGIVDDYFGDGLKADFGVPFARAGEEAIAEDARHAVTCALDLADALELLNATYRERGLPAVAMRVGIHTGWVVAGSLGSEDRLKYTTMGDVVVTAERLQTLSEVEHDYGRSPCRILISDRTLGYLGDGFLTESLGEFSLRGKADAVAIHRVLDKAEGPQGSGSRGGGESSEL